MKHSFYVQTAKRITAHAAWVHPERKKAVRHRSGKPFSRLKSVSRRNRKALRRIAMLLGLALPAAAGASPVTVTHDIRSDGPSRVVAEGILHASPEKIWSQMIRFNEYASFMPHVLESFFITEEGVEALKNAETKNANKLRAVAKEFKTTVPRKEGQKWSGLVFMVLNTPFPVENRWYVIRSVQDETGALEHKFKRCWELAIGNIDAASGCWTISPGSSSEETLSRYEDQADPGGNVPEWVTRMGATQTIPQMFEKVEKLAQSLE